jgi:hypothetical protein
MAHLRKQGIISETIASFSLNEESSKSYVSFGERDPEQYVGPLVKHALV